MKFENYQISALKINLLFIFMRKYSTNEYVVCLQTTTQ